MCEELAPWRCYRRTFSVLLSSVRGEKGNNTESPQSFGGRSRHVPLPDDIPGFETASWSGGLGAELISLVSLVPCHPECQTYLNELVLSTTPRGPIWFTLYRHANGDMSSSFIASFTSSSGLKSEDILVQFAAFLLYQGQCQGDANAARCRCGFSAPRRVSPSRAVKQWIKPRRARQTRGAGDSPAAGQPV